MVKYLIILILICSVDLSVAQTFNINLSPKHSQKLSTINSGHKRLSKFYKFYKKDSTKHVKNNEKHYRKLLDSTYRAEAKQERIKKRLAKQGIVVPDSKLTKVDTVNTHLKEWYRVMKDTTSSDSLKKVARQKVKTLAIEKAKLYPGFQHLMDQYQINGDSMDWQTITNQVPGLDTLSGVFDSTPEQLFEIAEQESIKQFQSFSGSDQLPGDFGEAGKLKDLSGKYQDQYNQYTDKEKLKNEGKEKAVEKAVDYFTKNADKLNMSHTKLSKLLNKYKDIPNSNDLSTAIKKTSMQGKTFWERLVVGGNFNILSTDPVSVDLSPQLGYKFTSRFAVGLGMNYRHTFGDSIKSKWYVSPKNTGFKLFSSYEVAKGFFGYTEVERSGFALQSNDRSSGSWKTNYFVGIGKKVPIHPKLYLNTMLLYNLNGEDKNPVHPKRFQIRLGFQLSELATRKERISYNPNR